MKKIFLIWLIFFVAALAVFIFSQGRLAIKISDFMTKTNNPADLLYEERIVKIGGKEIIARIADDGYKRQLGLSGQPSLMDNQGMLFWYTKPSNPGFWMKGMNFDIDIFWIRDNRIVDITPSVNHNDQETIYHSRELIDTVLELQSGFAARNNVQAGDYLEVLVINGGRGGN